VKVRWNELALAVEIGQAGSAYLLDGRDGGTAGDNVGEDVALHGDTKGKGNNVEEEHVGGVGGGGLAGEDTGLDGGTVGDSLVGVNALLELLAAEEVGKELLDLGDTGGATNEDDLVNLALVDARIFDDLLHGLDGTLERLLVNGLELGPGDLAVEVGTVEEGAKRLLVLDFLKLRMSAYSISTVV